MFSNLCCFNLLTAVCKFAIKPVSKWSGSTAVNIEEFKKTHKCFCRTILPYILGSLQLLRIECNYWILHVLLYLGSCYSQIFLDDNRYIQFANDIQPFITPHETQPLGMKNS